MAKIPWQISIQSRLLFGSRLHLLLGLNDMETTDLADAIGVTAETVRNWIKGKHEPKLSNLVRMVHVLHLRSIEELIGPLPTSQLRLIEYGRDVNP